GILVIYGLLQVQMLSLRIWFVLSFVLFTLFNLWWLGSDPKFWLPLLPLFIMLAGIAVMSLGGNIKQNRFLEIICLLIPFIMIYCNLPGEIPSILFPRGGHEMQLAREFVYRTEKPNIIFSPGTGWPNFVSKISQKDMVINLVYGDLS